MGFVVHRSRTCLRNTIVAVSEGLRGKGLQRRLIDRINRRAIASLDAFLERLCARAIPVLRRPAASALAPVPAGATPTGPRRTVGAVVVAYNSADCIVDCLDSLRRTAEALPHVSLLARVVDNDSKDATPELLASYQGQWPLLEVLKPGKNLGFGQAINLALKGWDVDDLLLVNPDALVTSQALGTLLAEAERTRDQGFRAWEARQFPYEHPKVYDPVTLETEWVSGACSLIDTAAFRQVGGFDSNIFLYAEDVDLSWRLRAAGFRLRYVPRATVEHHSYEKPGQIKPTQFFHGVVSNGLMRHKYGNRRDLLDYYLRWGRCLLLPPLPNVRARLIADLVRILPRFFKVRAARPSGMAAACEFQPRFSGWDYEVRRTGVFYPVALPTQDPLVSIIVRTKNRPSFLREALASLRNQTYSRLQVIVVEDGPSASSQIIAEFPDLDVVYRPLGQSQGRCRAGNIGLQEARGDFCGFLDDDDLMFADHVETLVSALLDQPENLAAYSVGFEVQTRLTTEEPLSYVEGSYRVALRLPFDRELLAIHNLFPINSVLFSRRLFTSAGGLDPELDMLEDWDLWLRYSRETNFTFVDKTTFLYRVPLDPVEAINRQAALDSYYDRVRAKHDAQRAARRGSLRYDEPSSGQRGSVVLDNSRSSRTTAPSPNRELMSHSDPGGAASRLSPQPLTPPRREQTNERTGVY